MQTTNTSHVNRLGFQAFSVIALLMIGSALMGALAGRYWGQVQISGAAPSEAPSIAQPAPAISVPLGYSDANELWQEKNELRSRQSPSGLAPVQALPLGPITSTAEREELQREVNDLRQMRGLHPTEGTRIQPNPLYEGPGMLDDQQFLDYIQ